MMISGVKNGKFNLKLSWKEMHGATAKEAKEFLGLIKSEIPFGERRYDDTIYEWVIVERHRQKVVVLAESYGFTVTEG